MKKTITKYFIISLLLALLSLVFNGCSSAKKYKQENTLLKSEIQKRDSLKSVIINQAIDDKLITPVVQSSTGNSVLDSLVNAKVDEILSKLNTGIIAASFPLPTINSPVGSTSHPCGDLGHGIM